MTDSLQEQIADAVQPAGGTVTEYQDRPNGGCIARISGLTVTTGIRAGNAIKALADQLGLTVHKFEASDFSTWMLILKPKQAEE